MIEARRYLQGQVADGRFPLIQYLGGTEHSAVFLTGYAESENQKAAIKLIPAPPGNTEPQLTRWRLAARFSHPHLLRLFEAGRCTLDNADMLYVVMEYAEENLAEILSQRPLSPTETSDLLGPVLEALDYIHGRGFVHGHIQPSNIVAIGDQVKLSSDRIRRIGEPAERRNGNARYCAPECATGDLSPASDVWSLGMTLVECLTEHLPEMEEGNRGMVSLPAELPAPFLELARHCLTKAPQRRWNVSELKARLQRNPSAVVEEVVAPVVRREAPAKRHYPLPLAALGVVVAMVVLGMAFLMHSSHTKQTRAAAMESPAAQTNIMPASEQASSKAQTQPQPLRSNGESSAVREVDEAASATPAALRSPPTGELARGGVVHRALPDVPRYASDTISGTVRVRVRVEVDPSGNVAGAEFDSAGPSRYFARLSMGAAREWKFRPPDANAKNIPSEWVIRFGYTKGETTATAVERNP
jgi:TonB family protein